MPEFFHVSRRRQLMPNALMTRSQRQLPPGSDPAMQAHLDALFPNGLAEHGNEFLVQPHYTVALNPHTGAAVADPAIELIYEFVRRAEFAERPSRYESYFGCETLADAQAFRAGYGQPTHEIWRVEADNSFRADMNALKFLDVTALVVSDSAHTYWSGTALSVGTPRWEHLLAPPVIAVQRVDPP